jgi:hypothetical protein
MVYEIFGLDWPLVGYLATCAMESYLTNPAINFRKMVFRRIEENELTLEDLQRSFEKENLDDKL